MNTTEWLLLALVVLVVVGVTLVHFHLTAHADLLTDVKHLLHLGGSAPASPVTVNTAPVTVTVHPPPTPVAPANTVAVANVPDAPRTPTPAPTPWPAGSKLVRNTELPGSPIGEPALSFAAQRASYQGYQGYQIDALQSDPAFAPKVWREDGPDGRGAYWP